MVSTEWAFSRGAYEANSIMRWAQDNLGPHWVAAKLAVCVAAAGGVLWLDDPFVVAIALLAWAGNAVIVWRNYGTGTRGPSE